MHRSFDQIPDHAKLWVFRTNETLEGDYMNGLKTRLVSFMEGWESHGSPVFASFEIIEPHFLLVSAISADGNPSGCSTDKLVHFFEKEKETFQVDFLNNSDVFYLSNQAWSSTHFSEIQEKIESGIIEPDTLLANLQVTKKGDYPSQWLIKAGDSWMKRNFASVKS